MCLAAQLAPSALLTDAQPLAGRGDILAADVMDDTLERHRWILESLADRRRRKSIFRPALGVAEARVYLLIAERLRRHAHTISIPQLAEVLGCSRQRAFDIVYGLVRKGWLAVASVNPREPWLTSRWRAKYIPSLEAGAFQNLRDLVEIALAAAELKERPAWKLDLRSLRRRAEAALDAIAKKTAQPTYHPWPRSRKAAS